MTEPGRTPHLLSTVENCLSWEPWIQENPSRGQHLFSLKSLYRSQRTQSLGWKAPVLSGRMKRQWNMTFPLTWIIPIHQSIPVLILSRTHLQTDRNIMGLSDHKLLSLHSKICRYKSSQATCFLCLCWPLGKRLQEVLQPQGQSDAITGIAIQ